MANCIAVMLVKQKRHLSWHMTHGASLAHSVTEPAWPSRNVYVMCGWAGKCHHGNQKVRDSDPGRINHNIKCNHQSRYARILHTGNVIMFGWSVARTEWKNTGVSRKKKEKSIQSRILPKQIKLCLLFWSLNQFPHLFIVPICRSVAECGRLPVFRESRLLPILIHTHKNKQHNVVHFCIILGENVAFCPYVRQRNFIQLPMIYTAYSAYSKDVRTPTHSFFLEQ